jgi:hypothetical protein
MLLTTDRAYFGTKNVPEGHVVSIRKTLPAGEYRAFIADSIAKLQRQIVADRLKIAGAPFAVFHDRLYWDREVDVSVCVPVRAAVFGKHRGLGIVEDAAVAFVQVPAGACEDEIRAACDALERYVCDNDWIFDGDLREVYPHGTGGTFEIQMPVSR